MKVIENTVVSTFMKYSKASFTCTYCMNYCAVNPASP